MTEVAGVQAFGGVRYNGDVVGDLNAVVAPPYDVISPEQKDGFLARHPNNVVRLILPDETPEHDKYSRAAQLLQEWMSIDILVQDAEPSMYVCEQSYDVGGETIRRIGLTCLIRLEDYGTGAILPHERVLARPREDRLNLIRATRTNFDSIFGLHNGEGVQAILKTITEGEPAAEATDTAGVACRMWKVSDTEIVDDLALRLNGEPILIADGHHRYDSALAYRNEMRAKTGRTDPDAPHEFVMMTLVSFEDEGLTILPTHRFVRELPNLSEDEFLAELGEYFEIEQSCPDMLCEAVAARHNATVFGLYLGSGKAYVLRLRDEIDPTDQEIPGSNALKRLDVTVLHSMVLDGILHIDTKTPEGQAMMGYTRDDSEAINRVDSGEFHLSFIMNTMGVDEVRAVAAAGDIMPQKSTFFYPKLLTGMVMRVME